MHLDKFNKTLIRIKPEKNRNCLPICIKDLNFVLDEKRILSRINLSINSKRDIQKLISTLFWEGSPDVLIDIISNSK